MANGGARLSIPQENPAVPPPRQSPVANANPPPRYTTAPREIESLIDSFRSANAFTRQEREMCFRSLFNLMTSSDEDEEGSSPFKDMISRLNRRALLKMASLMTSYSDSYFLKIARDKNGCNSLQELLGKSHDVDACFLGSILRRFFDVMTDRHAYCVAVQGMRVFSQEKKIEMWSHVHHHALDLACDQRGCIALKAIITVSDNSYWRNYLIGMVVLNALSLSYDAYGNFVVQHVLDLNDLRHTYNIAVRLQGRFVELSFLKYGSYIVEKLLETHDCSSVMVVAELLECEIDSLLRMTRGFHGNSVVVKALSVTQMIRADLFWGLVHKLMPSLHILRGCQESRNIAEILESVC
ncbi:unnamed protein product [Microthlaspi erraticum]|uniref:PUM-HD domain-containing protein n=1 Tax=Microthlaspi erraticum TaxID=1685480 RepID=A0A6D2J477_9BRAS|nr:unnamed protein product [Microthlaspi erraticum]